MAPQTGAGRQDGELFKINLTPFYSNLLIGAAMRVFLFAALSMILAGCVSVLSYKEPNSGPRARVRFVYAAPQWSVTVLRQYDDDSCQTNENEMMRFSGSGLRLVRNGGLKRLGIPLWTYSGNEAKEVYISSAKPFNGAFFGPLDSSRHYSCAVAFTIFFEESKDYEIVYSYAPRSSNIWCSVKAYEILESQTGHERHEIPVKINISDPCQKAFKKRRWS